MPIDSSCRFSSRGSRQRVVSVRQRRFWKGPAKYGLRYTLMRKGSQICSEDRLGLRPYWGDSDEGISLGRGFGTALQPCCNFPKGRGWPDRSIFSLTQSGTTTALNSSCTDMPLSLASADIVLNGSSRIDSMNFAIADKPPPLLLPRSWVYNNLYTVHLGGQELLRSC